MDLDLDYIEAPVSRKQRLWERFFLETKTHGLPRQFPSLRQNLTEQTYQAILNILVVYISALPLLVLAWYFLYKYFASKNKDDKTLDELNKDVKFLKMELEIKMLKKEVKMLKKQIEENRDERVQGLEMNLGMGDQLLDQDENGEG